MQVYGPLTLGAESAVRIDGDHAPAFGVNHVIISHTGARTGEFNALPIADFPGAEGCEVKLSYFASGSGGDVILRVSPKGTLLLIN